MKNVLIIDDQSSIKFELSNCLIDYDVECVLASDGEEGIEKLKSGSFDLVITDVAMPGSDGLYVLDQIRNKLNSDIPIILMSGYTEGNEHGDLSEYKLLRVMKKPLQIDKWVEVFDSLFDKIG